MASWREVLAEFVVDVEDHYDMLKYRLRERLGDRDPIKILPYRGYGNRQKIYLKGRVLEDKEIPSATEDDNVWNNLLNMYKRFDSDEIPYARVRVRFQDFEQVVESDEEGFFEVWITPTGPLPEDRLWHSVDLDLIHPFREGYPPVHAEGQVLVPPPGARFGVISDIDDTVVQTDAVHMLHMARIVFLGNARTRLPFKGVAAFYRALLHSAHKEGQAGTHEAEKLIKKAINPLFYVSSSPWNIYDLLSDFFHLQNIPIGPILFLRDWGLSEEELLNIGGHRAHKLRLIDQMMDLYQDLPFILIGDSGQEDPEIYAEIVDRYPNRVLAIYIRNVSRNLGRSKAIHDLAKNVAKAGSALILADDTVPMAEHAAENGWISPEDLPAIRIEKAADEQPPSPVEKLLGEEEKEEAPTVVVEAETPQETEQAVESGAVEQAMEQEKGPSKKPPTVVVKGEEDKQREQKDEKPGRS